MAGLLGQALGGLGGRFGETFGFGDKPGDELEGELRARLRGQAITAPELLARQRQNAALAQALGHAAAGGGNPALAARQGAEALEGQNARLQETAIRENERAKLQAAEALNALENQRRDQRIQGFDKMLGASGQALGFLAGQGGGDQGQDGGLAQQALSGGGQGGGGGTLGAVGGLAGTAVGGPLGGMAGGAIGNALGGAMQEPPAPPGQGQGQAQAQQQQQGGGQQQGMEGTLGAVDAALNTFDQENERMRLLRSMGLL